MSADRRGSAIGLAALGLAAIGLAALSACGQPEATPGGEGARPEAISLRYHFTPGRELRYESRTVERAARELTIEMSYRRLETGLRPDGAGEVALTIDRYAQRVFPPTLLPQEARRLNKELSGAQFRFALSPEGQQVTPLGQEGLPEGLSAFTVEALRTSLRGHVLRLPDDPVRLGQRWTVESAPPPDAGPEGVVSRSRWRVTSIHPARGKQMVELVCLSTMAPRELQVEGRAAHNRTEFHYAYQWNATDGVLEALSSTGTTTTVIEASADGGPSRPSRQQVSFDASLRLVR